MTVRVLADRHSVEVKNRLSPRLVISGAFLLLGFGTFKFFPGMDLINNLFLVLLICLVSLAYLPYKAIRHRGTYAPELYVIVMIIVVPLYAAILAVARFDQPFTYGALSQRWALDGATALLVCIGLQSGYLRLRDIERALIGSAWVLLCMYVLMSLLLNPENYASYVGFVSGGSEGTYQFRFDNSLIVLAFLYYGLRAYRSRGLRNYTMAAAFIAYLILVAGGRSQLLAAIGAFLFLTVRWGKGSRRILLLPKLLIGAGGLALILLTVAPSYMQQLAARTSEAISVVAFGQSSMDASANARIAESLVAAPFIEHHLVLGNGSISNQWHGGYQSAVGAYFYPSDIGFLGVLFVYGLLGAIAFALPLGWIWFAGRRMAKQAAHSPLTDALFGYLLYAAVRSLATGELVWAAAVCWTFMVILYYASRNLPKHLTSKAH